MEVIFAPQALEDLAYWKISGNKIIQEKIQQLIKSMQETPFDRIGKPEKLKRKFSGYWSRRINHEHRLVYKLQDEIIIVSALRYHY